MILKKTTKYLFDTSVFLGYLRNQPIPHDIMKQAAFMSSNIYYSIITDIELWIGIRGKREEVEHIRVLRPFNRYFLNVTIARRAAEIHKTLDFVKNQPTPSLPDCILAATAEYHNLTVITKNSSDFKLFTTISCEFF